MNANEIIARLETLKEKGLISDNDFTAVRLQILRQTTVIGADLPLNFSLNLRTPTFKPILISDVMARISAQNKA